MFASRLAMFPTPAAVDSTSSDASPFRFDINQAIMATYEQQQQQQLQPPPPPRHSEAYAQVVNRSGNGLAAAVFPRGEAGDVQQYTTWTPHPSSYNSLNSRPLTAPSSSISLHSQQGYAPGHARHPSGPMAPPFQYQQPLQQQQHWPSVLDPHQPSSFRGRGFSLPDLAMPGLPDEPSHAKASPFLYQPPPPLPPQQQASYHQQPSPTFNLGLWQQQQQRPATATTGGSYRAFSLHGSSRPSTASDRPDTASSTSSTVYGQSTDSESGGRMVPMGGQSNGEGGQGASSPHKKRPRRRYEEIDRMYTCNYPGCTKGYGTLNHLNAHVTMQRHGPKRLPHEFKEMRKAWRERKKAAEARREAEGDELGDRTPSPPPRRDSNEGAIATSSAPCTLASTYSSHHLSPDVPLHAHGIIHGDSSQWGIPTYSQPSYPISRTAPVHPYADGGRPQTAPAPLAYPIPLRPSTAPSSDPNAFNFLHHDIPLPLSNNPGLSSCRRASLPMSNLLPTLPEALDDGSQFTFDSARPPSPGEVSF